MHTLRLYSIALYLLVATSSWLKAENSTPSENYKIERLITHLENLSKATFIRNGREYDAKTAAKFLRSKWQANLNEIKTASDFILKVATKSSSSGKPYLIRLNTSSTFPCSDYLKSQLNEIESSAKKK